MNARRRWLLVGSGNPSKIARWGAVFPDYEVVGPRDAGIALDVEEGEPTVVENATRKALEYARASGLVTLSEDAGLRLAALDGFPGVELRTWGGRYPERLGDTKLAALLAEALHGVEDTSAFFDIGVAVASPDGFVRTALDESPGYFDLRLLDAGLEMGNPLSSAFVSRETGQPWTEMIDFDSRPSRSRRFATEVRGIVAEVFRHAGSGQQGGQA